jgi:hypothetical protein
MRSVGFVRAFRVFYSALLNASNDPLATQYLHLSYNTHSTIIVFLGNNIQMIYLFYTDFIFRMIFYKL